ncbi:MAG: formate C-acetyltransferase [Acutalibacteraceae bacterium]|nr:formate C-acetyltransferase [Acutalibacteraceae bacterium]
MEQWNGFKSGAWQHEINVADFIAQNYTPYLGDASFLEGPSDRTKKLCDKLQVLLDKERENNGVLDVDTETVTTISAFAPGYLDKDLEQVVGFQTDAPLKRSLNPFGGMRMVKESCDAYGYKMSDKIEEEFKYRTTHNDGVFSVYNEEMRLARHAALLTGLPDAYGRGRIIGDYRRVALYGIDYLIEQKKNDKKEYGKKLMDEQNIRLLEEISFQIKALNEIKVMAEAYGFDISKPASTAKEAFQWVYFGYLAAIKEQNGAAMSMGRVNTFLDIYVERDMKNGTLTESEAQELVDHFVMKLRCARHLRTPAYNKLFGGDPTWVTESIGGLTKTGKPLVTKNSFRFLNTLYTMGPAPEPNMTVLWSEELPEGFKEFCAKVSIDTDSIQYENDDVMRPMYGDNYGIACCVSAMDIGKQMQFFGARCNLAKILLLAINGGYDNVSGIKIGPQMSVYDKDILDYDEIMARFSIYREWLCKLYVNTMNVIHFMHDKYAYESIQMALHDTNVHRFMAFGVAGLSCIADSLSAIKYATVKCIRDENGYVVDFETTGDFPKYGNDDDRVDRIAVEMLEDTYKELKKTPTYKNAEHTLSALTITSNVVYGKKTGSTPDGRKQGEPLAPGANPMHNRETNGALASLNSVAKLPYRCCRDGISNTFSIIPEALGKTNEERVANLVNMLDGYFHNDAHHLNVNVLNKDMLIEAYNDPTKYPNLTIRVSGYAVNFHKLTKEQQKEVISRTFHQVM